MGVIHRLKGVNFNNTALPIAIFPGSYVIDGLVAGYRFGVEGTVDISGNGHTLTASGSPIIASGFANILPPEYYDTGITLGSEYTVIGVFRLPENPNGNHYLMGDHVSAPENAGLLVFSRVNNFAGLQVYSSDQPLGLYNGVSGPQVNGAFSFQAIRVGADKTTSWRIPKSSYISNKTFTGSLKTSPGTFKLGQTNVVSGIRPRDFVEVLIYSRALTDDEIATAYEMSQLYAAQFGIAGI